MADSEGRPGPFTSNRSHAEGANMLAEAVSPTEAPSSGAALFITVHRTGGT